MIENVTGPTSPAQKPSTPSDTSAKGKTAATPTPAIDTAPISPRLRYDPTAGVIVTEFLTNGSVQAQVPSAAVLAYLRAGLGPDGLSKAQEQNPPAKDSTNV